MFTKQTERTNEEILGKNERLKCLALSHTKVRQAKNIFEFKIIYIF